MTLKLIFMGTPAFALPTLQALHEAGHDIVAVYTAPPRPAHRGQKETPTPVHQYALPHGLNVLTPATLKTPEAQNEFAAFGADAAIVAAYGLLLPPAILTGTRMGCLNVHPSLLPRWRGAAPIQRAVMAGDKETGIVIMQMNEGLDTGDMLLTERYPIKDGTSSGELHDMLAREAGPLMLKTLDGLANGTIKAVKQPEDGVTYAKKILKEEARIDWAQPAQTLRHRLLGLTPQPGAFFMYKDEAIKLLDAVVAPATGNDAPGTVLDTQLTVRCGEGALRPVTVQRPGKKPMKTQEMLQGFAIPAGSRLE